jgi:lysozyme
MGLAPSAACTDLIRCYEGCVLTAYRCPAGVWTIGYGATGPGIQLGLRWNLSQAEQRLQADVSRFGAGVARLLGSAATSQHQFDAMVSFAFNLGLGAFEESTLLRKHRDGDFAGAAAEFGRWTHGGGRVLPGLVKRRAAEAALYRS